MRADEGFYRNQRSWSRHCATSQKVAGSIPDGVIAIFHWRNPSGRNMALGSTQSLTEMSTRNISWGVKADGAWRWQSYPLHVPIVLKSGSLNHLEPSGPSQACNGIAFLLLVLILTCLFLLILRDLKYDDIIVCIAFVYY